ncbi:thiamine pyrophosphate-binding protein [Salinirubellus sp. GCM10025818]|uniref:thiamine pyrophosphate-binding protein n=1 Tax=Salinirubellus TaxID=2162630 RepID=UPI0030CBFD4B
MPQTGADLFTGALERYGVSHLFGNPGTTELPIMNTLGGSDLEYVLAVHEDVAVGMAAGYAKRRAQHAHDAPDVNPAGVVNLHIGPGVAHGLGNVFDSSLVGTGAPLVVTAGQHPTDHAYHEPNLGADLVAMADQFTKWSAEVTNVNALPTMLRRAFRVALTPPTGPVFLSLPFDVMTAETDAEPERLGSIPNAGEGDSAAIDRAAAEIASADEPVLVVGDLVARTGPDAVAAAGRLADAGGMRAHGEFKASEVAFPAGHDAWFGRLPRDQELAAELLNSDTVVFVGVVSNTTTNPPELEHVPSSATTVHVSNHAWELGKNHVADIALLGDPGSVMDRLADRLEERISTEEREPRTEAVERTRERLEREADTGEGGNTSDPRASDEQLATAMHAAAPDALVVAEAPTSAGALRETWEFEPGQYTANRGGGLGYGLPAAIGTAIAERESPDPHDVLALVGDGSYLYYPQSLYTAARYDVDLTVVVPDNRNYRILKDNTLRLFGGEEDDYDFVGMDFDPPVDIPANAESHGASGRLIEDPEGIEVAVTEAVAEAGPTVLDVLTHD